MISGPTYSVMPIMMAPAVWLLAAPERRVMGEIAAGLHAGRLECRRLDREL